MKIVFAAVLLALVVYVSGETCHNTQECVNHGITTCGGSYHVVCHNGHCECLQQGSTGSCTTVDQCADCDGGRHKHCIDGHCRCTRF